MQFGPQVIMYKIQIYDSSNVNTKYILFCTIDKRDKHNKRTKICIKRSRRLRIKQKKQINEN